MLKARACSACGRALTADAPREVCEDCATVIVSSPADEKTEVVAGPLAETDAPRKAPAARPRPAPQRACPRELGDYELLEEVAHGGAGIVYKARQKSLHRVVALKMMLADDLATAAQVARFRVEAEAAASLDHPNIVPVYEVAEEAGHLFYTMKLIDGEMLSSRIQREPLSKRETARLVATVARAIHYGHQRGILHRDLKPANILVESTGIPYVVDFGLAKRVEGPDALTRTGDIMGTPNYMAPEQMSGRRDLTTAVDVYGLGGTLYELLTGRPPFQAPSLPTIMRKVLEEEPAAPHSVREDVDADLETICLKCLEKDPARRYASAEALARDLESWLAGEPIEARPVTSVVRAAKWVRRRPAMAGLILVSLLAILGAIAGGVFYVVRISEANRRQAVEHRATQEALVRNLAERLDSELLQLARVPRTVATGLAQPGIWNDRALRSWVERVVSEDARIFGVCVAFEPYAFDPARKDYALYVWRKGDRLEVTQLLPPRYKPYRTWAWYRRPLELGEAVWEGPYFDEGGGNVPMVTYATPIERQGRRIGVATVDLSLEYFRRLANWVHDLLEGEGDHGFVVNRDGTFVSHPDAQYAAPRRIPEGPGSSALLRHVLAGEAANERGLDFSTQRPCIYFTAPVSSSGWAFVAVLPD